MVSPKLFFDATPSVIVTSATLTTGGSFEHTKRELGVRDARELVVESPFDFERQALLIVPEGLPSPQEPVFVDAVADVVARVVDLAEGRTLGLFTSYRNMNAAYERLAGCGYRVLRQGDAPRTQLIEAFRKDVRSVLLGTESFWAGVDVPGESLSCVIIDRLPFPPPDDPVLDAVSERDPDWFQDFSLPRAIIAFKQGFGRLIRSQLDRGVVVVLDERLVTKRYGRKFIRSLPYTLKSRRLAHVRHFLEEAA
jgi:ATP-dependent DNA helicase DinG